MAYIPDEAIQDSLEISSSAWRIYCFLCMRRNHTKKYAIASIERIQAILGISRSNAYKTINSLVSSGWIEITGQQYTLCKGSFGPVDRESFDESKNRDNLSQKMDNLSQKMDSPLKGFKPRFKPGSLPDGVASRPWQDTIGKWDGVESAVKPISCIYCEDSGTMYSRVDHDWRTCSHCQPELPMAADAAANS